MKRVVRFMALTVVASLFVVVVPRGATAVILCNNLTGTPPPTPAMPQVFAKLRYINGPGGGDDKVKTKKGTFDASSFDPVTTDDVIVTIYDGTTELQMFTATMPAGTFWTHPNLHTWKYKDPLSTFGVRKSVVKGSPPDPTYLLRKIVGKNDLLTNVPFPNSNGMILVLEVVDQNGNGVCYASMNSQCITNPNKQKCELY